MALFYFGFDSAEPQCLLMLSSVFSDFLVRDWSCFLDKHNAQISNLLEIQGQSDCW